MATLNPQERARRVWAVAGSHHGVIAHFQLVALGYTAAAIRWRIARGRLHPVRPRVYAVGRRDLTREGEWMAALLTCGRDAALSHESAAALWGVRRERTRKIHVSMPVGCDHRQRGIVAHRRTTLGQRDITRRKNVPVTTPAVTLIDLATCLPTGALEAAINKADKLDLISPPSLREALDARAGHRGVRPLRDILDRATFVLTESALERRFLPIAVRAGLPRPRTQEEVSGFRVDFYWPELGLVVETDGLRYHRTTEEQARDRLRDQAHTAAGLTALRFTHWQVRHDPQHVERILRAAAHPMAA